MIIGGGIAGLTTAWRLEQLGIAYRLIEARPRLGGRIHSIAGYGGEFDLGPSWIWPGQAKVAGLLAQLNLTYFSQQSLGDIIHQTETRPVKRHSSFNPMADACRIKGGTRTLTDAIANELPAEKINLEYQCREISYANTHIRVRIATPDGIIECLANKVALALPPRLAANINYTPTLSEPLFKALRNLPTWMAAHAKVLALYDRPFWRDQGLSGTAMSAKGPLAEVHDASPSTDGPYALFGFVGYPTAARQIMGKQTLLKSAGAQLIELFGMDAADPLELVLQDWSQEVFTADDRDREPLHDHPRYGVTDNPGDPWTGRLHFISAETAYESGGLIEGAVSRALQFAEYCALNKTAILPAHSKP